MVGLLEESYRRTQHWQREMLDLNAYLRWRDIDREQRYEVRRGPPSWREEVRGS